MLLFIMLIQLTTLLYIWKVESKILLEKERETLSYQLDNNAKLLLTHMESLEKELEFLATLEVMDDIVVKDIDKRIAVLLQKKSKDLSENIILLAMKDKGIVASSKKVYISKNFLKFQVPVYASFDVEKKIGSLWLLYPLKNLQELKVDNPHQTLWIEGKGFTTPKLQESIVVSKMLSAELKGWKLSLAYETEYALESINEIEKILLFAFMVALLALLFVVWVLSKRQINILHHTQEVLELKRMFLSTMSHELRTPLGSILNLTQYLMVSEKVGDEEEEILRRIENASEHLLGMINNLLQLSKLESNAMIITKESVDILELIEEMIEIVEPLIDEKNLLLKKALPTKKVSIVTDVNLFKQVVINLFSNAIKFTERGSITISLTEKDGCFKLVVIDTGIGIEKEKQEALFSEFYQPHMGSRDIKHSTGLGLALSQKVAQLIHGEIFIASEGKDRGTKATFLFASL